MIWEIMLAGALQDAQDITEAILLNRRRLVQDISDLHRRSDGTKLLF